ncbi:hypothetical protein SPI_02153 [Niveomyces insectorum RCEF 264]|uniref:Helix-turn-helix-domain containing protein type n=1 Tax=Niveomyces insectorum RCEF 264 TaxID=1081102 RepID=A0A167XT88_9HYPO|nr:hypothetical protein SPI_02153 [Niveomyces insectorum RCEF 264]
MPAVTLYEVSITTFTRGLKSLAAILDKCEAYAKEKGIDADSYVAASLAEDMKPLSFQIQVASNVVKKSVWRLTGNETESWADDETTIAQLKARVQKTLDLLKTVDAKTLEGKDDTIVELQMGANGTVNLPAKSYVLGYALPNFFFHITTAYGILRSRGVPLGKRDYLSNFMA